MKHGNFAIAALSVCIDGHNKLALGVQKIEVNRILHADSNYLSLHCQTYTRAYSHTGLRGPSSDLTLIIFRPFSMSA